jgi:hypothetical protein
MEKEKLFTNLFQCLPSSKNAFDATPLQVPLQDTISPIL